MKTDQQIYTLLGAAPEFLRLLTDGIAIRGAYAFEAIEVKGLDRRSDGVLLPEDPEESIWVIEFQAQWDETIYHRLVVEMGLVGERHLGREVRGLILFAAQDLDPKTQPWHRLAQQADPPVRVAYLHDILERLEAQNPGHPLLAVFLPYRIEDRERLRREGPEAHARIQQAPLPSRARTCLLDVFWSWLVLRFDELNYQEILEMFGNVRSLEQTRAYQDIIAMGRKEGMEEGMERGMEKGMEKGMERGMEKGMEKGRQSEACALVLRLARHRFGTVSADLETRIQALPMARLETLAEALLDFTTLGDVQAWLGRD